MTIEITLFGFGDDRPPAFNGKNCLSLEIETPATPSTVLRRAGIEDATGLVLMNQDQVIPPAQWENAVIEDQDRLTLLSAFEGG
jgi:sulfur carrier protein ThiS